MRKHLATLLDDFRRFDRQIAVVRYRGNRRRTTSYGEIAQLAGRFAALLAQKGIAQGERVLLWGENSGEWIAAFYGCMLRGVLAVPLDAYGSAEFAQRIYADVKPAMVVGDSALLRKLKIECASVAFENWLTVLPTETAGAIDGLSTDTPLQILFTSGTTGDPKGIVHTHGNVLASFMPIENGAQRYMKYERLFHPLHFLHTLPLSHVFGQMMGLWVPPIFAAEVHFENRLVAPRLIEIIRREHISVLAAVPRVLAILKTQLEIDKPGLPARITMVKGASPHWSAWKRWWYFRDIRGIFGFRFAALISGGGALPPDLEQFWNTLAFVLVQGYGMTETAALITLNHPFHVAEGTIGKPLPGREIKLGPDGELLVRGPMVSGATWSGGALRPRTDEWLSTGDLAEVESTGEFKFLGRKSEVIVTATGVNIFPEDLEAAVEQEPGVRACAVVGVETPSGPAPCAVIAFRGTREQAAEAIQHANDRLAEYQHILRWEIWPDPDLPRTSTGKIRRKAVAEWLAGRQQSDHTDAKSTTPSAATTDWLMVLISQITGEAAEKTTDDARLTEDLHLDSLGRIQLAAAIEERIGSVSAAGNFDELHTLGDLRRWIEVEPKQDASANANSVGAAMPATPEAQSKVRPAPNETGSAGVAAATAQVIQPASMKYIYPHWPWWKPVEWLRTIFVEAIMRPMVWLLATPKVIAPKSFSSGKPIDTPVLIIANHISTFDAPVLYFGLPGKIRRRIAVAMAGDMLEDFRHFRNAERSTVEAPFYLPGPLIYMLITALFNVFPLPQHRDFQRSFAHAGDALDHGYNVLVFPEGTRSKDGAMVQFRPGIGLLVKESGVAVLPMATRGLGDLKFGSKRWFRSGTLEVHVGEPMEFSADETEAAITARLQDAVAALAGEIKNV